MKKHVLKLIAVLLIALIILPVSACRPNDNRDADYFPDFPLTPNDGKDSWEHDNSEFSINWFVNYSWFSYPNSGSDVISKKIKEKTGVTVTFNAPIVDDGQMLSQMIAGESLPDVITLQAWYPQTTQLAMEGYVYPINGLAERWAPSLVNRLEEDVKAYYTLGDGNVYGLASCAYSNVYVSAEDKWAPNGALLVRKDWFEWYETQPDKKDITTPEGLIDAALRVKAQFTGTGEGKVNNLNGLLLDQFNNEGNLGVNWLSQYFASPFEDNNGQYVDSRTTPQYKETLNFLNDAYNKSLINKSNFSATADEIGGILSRGEAFVSLATPQNYPGSFMNAYNKGIEYIPLIVRNKAGEEPVLQDLTGNGFTLTMVTKNAARPDKIIKVLDFLYSEEGQRLVQFGIENDTWEWANEEKKQVKWTQKYLQMKDAGSLDTYGFGRFNTLYNPAYIEPIYPREGKKANEIYFENLKRPLMPISYRYTASWPKLDVTDKDYLSIVKAEAVITNVWAEYLPDILKASASNFDKKLSEAFEALTRRGLQKVTDFYKAAYAEHKQKMGISYGWPLNDPNFVAPTMRNLDGSFGNQPISKNGDNWYLYPIG